MLKNYLFLNNQIEFEYYPSVGNTEEDNGDENLTTT